jgi:hypothetical protein
MPRLIEKALPAESVDETVCHFWFLGTATIYISSSTHYMRVFCNLAELRRDR